MKPSTLAIALVFFALNAVIAIAVARSSSDERTATEEDEVIQALEQAADPDGNDHLQHALGD